MNRRQHRNAALRASLPLAVAALVGAVVMALVGALDVWTALGLVLALVVYFGACYWYVSRPPVQPRKG